jgi:proteasome lid subunit RPN8/RPN11
VLVFTDAVLDQISAGIAAFEPERGGALFGIRDSNVVCHLACDIDAKRTCASYLPSKHLQEKVVQIERQTNLIFRGIVHSHPGSLSTPSGQDLVAFGKALADNLHMASFVAPIITNYADGAPLAQHELTLPIGSRMSTYIATRSAAQTWWSGRSAEVERSAVTVMPIEEHLSMLCTALGTTKDAARIQRGYFSIGHVFYVSATMQFCSTEVIVLFPPIYPLAQPLVMTSSEEREAAFLSLSFGTEINRTLDRPGWIEQLTGIVGTMEADRGK